MAEHLPADDEHKDKEKSKSLTSKISGLFKKKDAHDQWPSSEPYFGIYHDTRHSEAPAYPLNTHVSVYHPSGRSDELTPRPVERDTASTRSLYHFPINEPPYLGSLDETNRKSELQSIPLADLTTPYHSGHYESLPKKIVEVKEVSDEKHHDLADTAKELAGKVTGLFKKKEKDHSDYPTTVYHGPVSETTRHREIQPEDLRTHVQSYNVGFYDTLPRRTVEVHEETIQVEEPKRKHPEGYPHGDIYEGPLETTSKMREVQGEPLQQHVDSYHVGWYEKLPAAVEESHHQREEAEPEKSITDKFGSLFRKKEHESEYPTWIDDSHPVDETLKSREIQTSDLGLHAVPPSQSYYDNLPIRHVEEQRSEFPINQEPYLGPLSETRHTRDLHGEPLTNLVSSYHQGFYTDLPKKPIEGEQKEGLAEKLTGIFKKKEHLEGYPSTEPYFGHLHDTRYTNEVESSPILNTVAVYSPGFYSDLPATTKERLPSEDLHKEKSKSITSKFGDLFKKKGHHEGYDYLSDEPYYGHLHDTRYANEVESSPILNTVAVYNPGFYSDLPPRQEPIPHADDHTEKSKSLTSKLGGFFKPKDAHSEYPTTIYHGPVGDFNKFDEVSSEPLLHHSNVYHQGWYDRLPPRTVEVQPEMIKEEPKSPKMSERISSLLHKKDHGPGYRFDTSMYTGPLSETVRATEIYDQPIQHYTSIYHPGYYDKLEQKEDRRKTREGYPSISEAYYGPLENTQRSREIDSHPLREHSAVYNVGHYNQLPMKEPKIATTIDSEDVRTAELRRQHPHGYPMPEMEYRGPLSVTSKTHDLQPHRIDQFANVYHVGEYDKLEPRDKPMQWVKPIEEVKSQTTTKEPTDFTTSSTTVTTTTTKRIRPTLSPEDLLAEFREHDPRLSESIHIDTVNRRSPPSESPLVLDPQQLETPRSPLGFSVSISARQKYALVDSGFEPTPAPTYERESRSEHRRSIPREDRGITISQMSQSYGESERFRIASRDAERRTRALSPHSWTTIRERTEISYIKRISVSSTSPPPRTPRSPLSPPLATSTPTSHYYRPTESHTLPSYHHHRTNGYATSRLPPEIASVSVSYQRRPEPQTTMNSSGYSSYQTYQKKDSPERYTRSLSRPSATSTKLRSPSPPRSRSVAAARQNMTTMSSENRSCKWTTFGERVFVHHPIYPPRQSPYISKGNGSPQMNGRGALPSYQTWSEHHVYRVPRGPTYSPVREIAAVDRTEWIQR